MRRIVSGKLHRSAGAPGLGLSLRDQAVPPGRQPDLLCIRYSSSSEPPHRPTRIGCSPISALPDDFATTRPELPGTDFKTSIVCSSRREEAQISVVARLPNCSIRASPWLRIQNVAAAKRGSFLVSAISRECSAKLALYSSGCSGETFSSYWTRVVSRRTRKLRASVTREFSHSPSASRLRLTEKSKAFSAARTPKPK